MNRTDRDADEYGYLLHHAEVRVQSYERGTKKEVIRQIAYGNVGTSHQDKTGVPRRQ